MYNKFQEHLKDQLASIEEAGLFKSERILTSPQGAQITTKAGLNVLNFCANNYLGLSNNPDLIAEAKKTLDSHGYGMSSVRFICGTTDIHKKLEDTISNFFGAVTVLLDRPFKVGDWVVVGDSQGEVIEINLRTTLIRTGIDTVITIPNANLVSTPVENYGKRRWRRWQSMLHFDLNSNPDNVEAFRDDVLKSIMDNAATMNEDSSWCRVNDISATSIDVSLNLYWDVQGGADERQEKEKFLLEVMQLAKNHGLRFYDNRIRQQM